MADAASTLHRLLLARLSQSARDFLEEALSADIEKVFPLAGRMLGKRPLGLSADDHLHLREAGIDWSIERYGADGLGRLALLLSACERSTHAELLLADLFRQGDSDERAAILRVLALLPQGERFVSLAVEACRTNVRTVFEAIACENPYPARHFPAHNFQQMVMKSLFLEVSVEQIVGLDGRITPELLRMLDDYEQERRASGRSIPAGIGYLRSRGGEQ
jgi:hypothetical protein